MPISAIDRRRKLLVDLNQSDYLEKNSRVKKYGFVEVAEVIAAHIGESPKDKIVKGAPSAGDLLKPVSKKGGKE